VSRPGGHECGIDCITELTSGELNLFWPSACRESFVGLSLLYSKPTGEIARLCRGGSKSLTFAGVHRGRSYT
jgi:hypothetical protein